MATPPNGNNIGGFGGQSPSIGASNTPGNAGTPNISGGDVPPGVNIPPSRMEGIKQYYQQLCNNYRLVSQQLQNPELPPMRRQMLSAQLEKLQQGLQEFTERVIKPIINANRAAGNPPMAGFPMPGPMAMMRPPQVAMPPPGMTMVRPPPVVVGGPMPTSMPVAVPPTVMYPGDPRTSTINVAMNQQSTTPAPPTNIPTMMTQSSTTAPSTPLSGPLGPSVVATRTTTTGVSTSMPPSTTPQPPSQSQQPSSQTQSQSQSQSQSQLQQMQLKSSTPSIMVGSPMVMTPNFGIIGARTTTFGGHSTFLTTQLKEPTLIATPDDLATSGAMRISQQSRTTQTPTVARFLETHFGSDLGLTEDLEDVLLEVSDAYLNEMCMRVAESLRHRKRMELTVADLEEVIGGEMGPSVVVSSIPFTRPPPGPPKMPAKKTLPAHSHQSRLQQLRKHLQQH